MQYCNYKLTKPYFKMLMSYYYPHKIKLLLDLLFSFFSSAVSVILPLIIKDFINNVSQSSYKNEKIFWFLLTCLLLIIIKFISDYFILYIGHAIGIRIEGEMKRDLFRYCQKMPLEFYKTEHTGNIISIFNNDIGNISELLHHGPEEIFLSLVKIIGAFIFLIRTSLKVSFILMFFLVIIVVFSNFLMNKLSKVFSTNRTKLSYLTMHIEENLSGIQTIQTFTNEKEEIKKFDKENLAYMQSKIKTYKLLSAYYGTNWALTALVIPLVVSAIYLFNKRANFSIELLAIILYLDIIVSAVFKLLETIETAEDQISGFNRFAEILMRIADTKEEKGQINVSKLKGTIVFDNVNFKYDRKPNGQTILKNLSFKIIAGSHVALVGESGAGKTTICNLITKFYKPSSGDIYIDGKNIKNINTDDLRKSIGVLPQKAYIFSGTIKENIKYGKLNATDIEIEEAAKKAHIHEYISTLKDGYNTQIQQDGSNFSEGQKQRIAIARLFLKDPSIIIMDEATSALDGENEYYIYKALNNLTKGKTFLIISHKLYAIKVVDRILVLNKNKIVEDGNHENLIKQNGVYTKLYNWQTL